MKVIEKARMGMIAVAAVMLESVARLLMGTRGCSSGRIALMLAGIVLVVVAGGAIAEHACVANDGSGDAYLCGDMVMKSCTFNGTMVCTNTTEHGLIIGANNITINGARQLTNNNLPATSFTY
ncbi:MAG: hypothetical protein C4B59_12225 [Candidatus Methanogaster sp.]|uniref:Uncharacterized protein n=1 Tax=Candidatus Methanogaster sp. TaxID=3386292 RepID=A0AC61L0I7_9EURY|nr:MAG: hypothetical protein C4B59_12225 [ANME-2 cluster archaeon]